MKYIFSFLVALAVMLILTELNIPDFLNGWFSCMSWGISRYFYETNKLEKT